MQQYRYKALDSFVDILERITKRYFTIHTRPMYSDAVLIDPKKINHDYSEYAIVMQGPVLSKNNFTMETLLLYKKLFPTAYIILSTWENEDEKCTREARNAGIEVIVNKKPDDAGPSNINLQLVSTLNGLRRATEKNKAFTLKTRTDVRIYNPYSLLFLANLLKNFPITSPGVKQKGRLISIHGKIYKWYWFPDQFVFGYTEDVALYFGASLLSRNTHLSFGNSVRFFTEQYLFTEFLKKIGYKLEHTLEDSSRAQTKHGVIIDAASLDWYWYKYKRFFEHRYEIYKPRKRKHILGFSEWLNLYNLYGGQK